MGLLSSCRTWGVAEEGRTQRRRESGCPSLPLSFLQRSISAFSDFGRRKERLGRLRHSVRLTPSLIVTPNPPLHPLPLLPTLPLPSLLPIEMIGSGCPAVRRSTGSSKIDGAKLSDACSVRADWLCMGWPFCLAEMRREFQTGEIFLSARSC